MPKSATGSKRLSPEKRKNMIVSGAIKFFAEHGFDISTHQLAKYLGVTQPLIYQYFPAKEDLIDAVYAELFENQWSDEWDGILSDRKKPLKARLVEFYTRYCEVIHAPEWIRIFLYSGLKSMDIAARYAPLIEERAIRRICIEAREELGLPGLDVKPLSNEEFESAWTMHGGVFYYGVRRYVYCLPIQASTEEHIKASVTLYLEGILGVAKSAGIEDNLRKV